MPSSRVSPRRSKPSPSSWRIISSRLASLSGPSTTCEKPASATIERSANAEAIRHLTQALELLQSRPEGPARRRAALGLEVMLSQAMIAVYGYAARETAEVLLRAKDLIDDVTDPAQKLAILYGIWAGHYVGGKVAKQTDAAGEFLKEAERNNDTAALSVAHRIMGTTYATKGEFAAALPHLEQARALYDPQHGAPLQYQYGQDVGAAALCYLSWALWHLGFVDQASQVAANAVKRAEELSHPHTQAFTICHARGMIDIFRRSSEDMRSYARSVVSLCQEHGLSHWLACGRILEGWATVNEGEIDRGIELLRAGVAAWREAGARLWLPLFLVLEAQSLHTKQGATKLRWARLSRQSLSPRRRASAGVWPRSCASRRACCPQPGAWAIKSRFCSPGALRLPGANRPVAGSCARLAILPRSGKAKAGQTKRCSCCRPIYAQFTEGFDTADLRHAKLILDRLEPTLSQKHAKSRKRTREPHRSG